MSNDSTPRRGSDGLTKDERFALYVPDNYTVTDLTDGWELTCGPATFYAKRGAGRGELVITSNTLGFHLVGRDGFCRCADAERARSQGRPCKHSACWFAVANHQARKRIAHRDAQVEVERAHQDLRDHVQGQVAQTYPAGEPQVVGRTASGGTITLTRNPNPPPPDPDPEVLGRTRDGSLITVQRTPLPPRGAPAPDPFDRFEWIAREVGG